MRVVRILAAIVPLAGFTSFVAVQTDEQNENLNWSMEQIEQWINQVDVAAEMAWQMNDHGCWGILSAAGAGYRNPNVQVSWNNNLTTNSVAGTTSWWTSGRITVEIDQNAPNVNGTLIHEGLHVSGRYNHDWIDVSDHIIYGCADAYIPH